MSVERAFLLVFLGTVLLQGCSRGMPDGVIPYSPQTGPAQWQSFLPIETILAADLDAFEKSRIDIAVMRARTLALRRRADILRNPVLDDEEKRRLLKASPAQLR